MIACATGLHLGVRSNGWSLVGFAFLVLSGIGLVWVFLFPAVPSTRSAELHVWAFIMTFFGAGSGLILMSRRMVGDPKWQSLATYTLATGIGVLVLLIVGGTLVRPSTAPLHRWWGLFQWVLLALWLPCTVVVAFRVVHLARAAEVSR
jgi:hypothetical membrane protein